MLVILSLVVLWFAWGLLGTGLSFAYFQKEYPFVAKAHYKADRRMAYKGAIKGPFFFIQYVSHRAQYDSSAIFRHGLKYW